MTPERSGNNERRERTLRRRFGGASDGSPNGTADPDASFPARRSRARTSVGNSDDALRDTRAAELQWREHGFGPWAIRDIGDNSFLGAAELRFAGDGIEGIAPNEVEAGWWVRENRRNQGIATEATRVAIGDVWSRGGVESVTAYIEEGD